MIPQIIVMALISEKITQQALAYSNHTFHFLVSFFSVQAVLNDLNGRLLMKEKLKQEPQIVQTEHMKYLKSGKTKSKPNGTILSTAKPGCFILNGTQLIFLFACSGFANCISCM